MKWLLTSLLVLTASTSFTQMLVTDGNSLRQDDKRIRLIGIDAPELSQTCRQGTRVTLCGRDARDALSKLIEGGVQCTVEGHDQWKRDLAVCFNSQDVDVGQALIKQGWAVPYKYAPRYTREFAQAKSAKRGMHAGEFIHPSDWRNGVRW